MKFIIKVSKYSLLHCYLIIMLAAIPITTSAQTVVETTTSVQTVVETSEQDVVDTSSPQDLLAKPTIIVPSSTVQPDCHTYTGCDVMVVEKKYRTYHKYKPKPKHIYHDPCYFKSCCPYPRLEFY